MQMWELFRHLGFERLLQIRLLKQRCLLTMAKFFMYLALSLRLSFVQRYMSGFYKVIETGLCLPFQIEATEFQSLLLHHIE